MTLRSTLLILFGSIGLAWYYVCLFVIGFSLSKDPGVAEFRSFMSLSITTIGVSLATFVGMLLGFRGVSEEIQKGVQESPAGVPVGRLHQIAQGTEGSRLQWIAAGLYALSLLLALFFWWHGGNTADPAIINLGKSLLGLIGGALSVLFNLPKQTPTLLSGGRA
jgi:hypothetical protein